IGDPYRNVLGIFMNQIMNGDSLTIFGDGEQTRGFTYIDDVAPQIASSVNVPAALNQVFNIGSDAPHTVHHLAGLVAEAFGVPLRKTHLPARNEVVHAFANHERARSVLGVRSTVELRDGVGRMVSWARTVGARAGKPFENIEVTRNLPPSWAALAR